VKKGQVVYNPPLINDIKISWGHQT